MIAYVGHIGLSSLTDGHLGRHLEYFKTLNDASVASLGFIKYNAPTTRINKEKNFKIKFQVILVFYQTIKMRRICPGHTFTDHFTGSTTDKISRMTQEMPISVVRYGCTKYVWLSTTTYDWKLQTNTDCHEWCRINSVANPVSSPWMCDLGPELQCLLKVKVDLNWRTYLNFTKSALQSFSLS